MARDAGVLPAALERRGRQEFTGILQVDGSPGGTVVLRDGLVAAASTPAAPGPESLLLRSGRIAEADWTAAFTAAAPHGRLGDELVRRGLLGDAGLQALTRTAVVDAVFAMVLGGVRSCAAAPDGDGGAPPVLPADPGLAAERVTREVDRRLAALAAWHAAPRTAPLSARSRPRATAAAQDAAAGGGRVSARRAVLDRADGRRTPRDIAFALGRGLFPVFTDLATLYEDGLAEEAFPGGGADGRAAAPPPHPVPAVRPDVPAGPHGSFGAAGELPRRRRRGRE